MMMEATLPQWLRNDPDADRQVPRPAYIQGGDTFWECRRCGLVYEIDESHGQYDGDDEKGPSCQPDVYGPPVYNVNTGERQYFIAVYSVTQHYGGPEEGGWWYESGALERTFAAATLEEAQAFADALDEIYPYTKKRYSVLGGADWDIRISQHLPVRYFPQRRPHYE